MGEFTRFVAVRPIRSNSDASEEVLRLIRYFEKKSSHTVEKIHTDGGYEFRKALEHLEDEGLEISVTTPYTPE